MPLPKTAATTLARVLVAAVCAVATLASAPSTSTPQESIYQLLRLPVAGAPVPLLLALRAGNGSVSPRQTYTVKDLGAPDAATFMSSQPQGFNNTGQIFGSAQRNSSTALPPSCVVYTDGSFVNVSAQNSIAGCIATSLNDANASGVFELVGGLQNVTDPSYSAFIAIGSAHSTTFALDRLGGTNPSSFLYGVNSSGTAAGTSFNAIVNAPPFLYSPATRQFTPLQRDCIAPGITKFVGCVQSSRAAAYSCPFGGCVLNDTGTLLGIDRENSEFQLFALSNGSSQDVPSTFLDSKGYENQLVNAQLNRFGLLAQDFVAGQYSFAATLRAGTASWLVLPALGKSCTAHTPLSMNDTGEVLGYDSQCSTPSDAGYWIWEPSRGLAGLALPAGSYASALPVAVNNGGQILVQLNQSAGPAHWGVLTPGGASSRNGPKAAPR